MKQPQMRFTVNVKNYGEDKYISLFSSRRDAGNRQRKYKFTKKRFIRYQQIIQQLWAVGRAVPDFTRAHQWGIDPIIPLNRERDYEPYSPEEGAWPYK